MAWSKPTARVELSSVCLETGARIDTLVVRMPRIILAEFNTHRAFSRNAASSRAIPFQKMVEQVQSDPFVPLVWTSEKKGMQGEVITDEAQIARNVDRWLVARMNATAHAEKLHYSGVHKSVCNRLLEPWMWTTVVMTACDFRNFFNLRCHPAAEHHMRLTAEAMRDAWQSAEPQLLEPGEWHLPFTSDLPPQRLDRYVIGAAHRLSVARCASVSYKTVDGFDMTEERAGALHDSLMVSGHWSPFEHQAAADATYENGNYDGSPAWKRRQDHRNLCGWRQYRAMAEAKMGEAA